MVWLPDGKKKFDDMFIRFHTTHERDRQTDTQTPHDGIGRAGCSILYVRPDRGFNALGYERKRESNIKHYN